MYKHSQNFGMKIQGEDIETQKVIPESIPSIKKT